MSTNKEVIEVLFNAVYKGQGDIRKLKGDINQVTSDFKGGISAVAGFSTALVAIEAAAIGAGIGLAKASVAASGEFGQSFNEISTLIDDTSGNISAFKSEVLDYASTSSATMEDLNTAIYNAISAGIDYRDSLDFIAVAEKASIAGKATLNDAVSGLTSVLNAYGMEADQAGRVSDILFATVKNGVTTFPELASNIGGVIGTASSLGISFEEVAAVISTLTKAGLSTGQAITSMKAAISNIIKPTKAASEVAEQYGIELGTSALQSKGFVGVMNDIADKTGGSKEEITKLFGSVEALNLAMIATSNNGAKTLNADLDSMVNSAGSAEAAYAKMAENMKVIDQKLANAIKATQITIGGRIEDEFGNITKYVTEIFDTLRKEFSDNGALSGILDGIEGIAQTSEGIFRNLSENLGEGLRAADFDGFERAFETINNALIGMDLGSVEGIANAVDFVGDSFNSLTQITVSIVDVVSTVVDLMGSAAKTFNEMDDSTKSMIGTIGGVSIALSALGMVLTPLAATLVIVNNMKGLTGALGLTKAVTQVDILSSKMGLLKAGLVAVLSYEVGSWAVEFAEKQFGWTDIFVKQFERTPELQKVMDDYAKSIGKASVSEEEYIAAMKKKHGVIDESIQKTNEATTATSDLSGATNDASSSGSDFLSMVQQVTSTLPDVEGASKNAGKALQGLGGTTEETSKKTKQMTEETKKAKAELDSLKFYELNVKLNTQRLKSETEQVKSIMDNLGKSAVKTGEALTSGFESLSSVNFGNLDSFAQDDVIESIKTTAEAQLKLAEAEERIAKAKAAFIDLQNKKMASGDSMIKVDGSGLAPHLEKIMFEVLKAVQLKISASQADFLLGLDKGGA